MPDHAAISTASPAPVAGSSRDTSAGAGWDCAPGTYKELLTKRDVPFAWLNPAPLWQSRNDRIARWCGDPTDAHRRAWMADRREANPALVVDLVGHESIAFLVMGDTGEGDASQYAVVPPLLSQASGTAFLFICSDVIYPAGGIDEYVEKFFRPYQGYDGPVYAVPGNH